MWCACLAIVCIYPNEIRAREPHGTEGSKQERQEKQPKRTKIGSKQASKAKQSKQAKQSQGASAHRSEAQGKGGMCRRSSTTCMYEFRNKTEGRLMESCAAVRKEYADLPACLMGGGGAPFGENLRDQIFASLISSGIGEISRYSLGGVGRRRDAQSCDVCVRLR